MTGTQKALRIQSPENHNWQVDEVPIPVPEPGELLVKIISTALNPVDWKIQKSDNWKSSLQYPAVGGFDASGVVEQVGEGVTGFAKGDRVVHQGNLNNRNALFQQYAVVPAEIVAKVPENITFDQAASIPTSIATAAVGLYTSAGIPAFWVSTAAHFIVVLGGSTSVGQSVLQFAKLSGFNPIIATASPRNKELVLSLGATHFINRNADIIAEVAKITSKPVEYIYDAVSLQETQDVAWELLAPKGTLILVLGGKVDLEKYKDKKVVNVYGNVHAEANRALGKELYARLNGLLVNGTFKPSPVEVLPNGLAGIIDGLERLSRDEISGTKLVARPQETA